MAQWALQFTPCVTTRGQQQTLLLEVAASLRLWGGLAALLNRLSQGWQDFGWQPPDTLTLAYGPTALHAQWLALYGAEHHYPAALVAEHEPTHASPSALTTSLSALPISVIEECQSHADVLARMGIRSIGQLYQLPRGGITRRFGKELLHVLDQAYGKASDVYPWINSRDGFSVRRELPARADHTTLIEQAALRCLHELTAWLIARQLGVVTIRLTLHHENPPPTSLILRFAGPTRDIHRFQRLLSERLARFQVKQPVYEISLDADATQSLAHTTQDFLGGGASEKEDLQILIERLAARLGPSQVQRLCMLDEYRPEQSVALQAVTSQPTDFHADTHQPPLHLQSHRPSWLLNPPIRLALQGHRPCYQGPLQLLCGPERIEAGWWDDGPVGPAQRDYFIARTPQSSVIWIFRTPSHDWYLHGFFS
jgi:protein ImuB